MLLGRGGRDFLCGMDGADVLDGGAGEDLLVPGVWNSPGSLDAGGGLVMAEWSPTDMSFKDRVEMLWEGHDPTIRGGGASISYVTARGDDRTDTVTGGAGNDWMLVTKYDVVRDLEHGDGVTALWQLNFR